MNLAKDLTARNGKGFSRSNLVYMRKFYLAFPICETVSHKLTWSHYFELLKCDNALEMQFLLQRVHQGVLESQGTEKADEKLSVSAICAKYR